MSSAIYSLPHTLEPQLHLILTGVGCYLGYLAHRYEEGSEQRTQMLLARYRHAPREWAEQVNQDSSTQGRERALFPFLLISIIYAPPHTHTLEEE